MESLPGYDAWKTATPPHYDDEYFECDGCELLIHQDDETFWDHTEGKNGLDFHSEECASNYWADRGDRLLDEWKDRQ